MTNEFLRARRRATPSPSGSGRPITQAELAEAVNQYVWEATGKQINLDVDTLARYERGLISWPGADYRRGLRAVLGASTDSELGFRPTRRGRAACTTRLVSKPDTVHESAGVSSEQAELAAALGVHQAPGSEVLSPLGIDGEMLWKVVMGEASGLDRRHFLGLVVAAGAMASDGVIRSAVTRSTLDPRTVESYAAIATMQQGLYWTLDARSMLDTALCHLRLGTSLLQQTATVPGSNRILAGAVARTALLTARVALFDLGLSALAARAFTVAEAAVPAAQDPWLRAAVSGHHAFLAGFSDDLQTARSHLDHARDQLRNRPNGLISSWVACVSAELHARNGAPEDARAFVGEAEQALADSGERPAWFDYYDASRLAGFAGNAELLAGRHDSAAVWLEEALNALDEKSEKQRAVLLLDLAAAQRTLDADLGAAYGTEAMAILETSPYGAAVGRLPGLVSAYGSTAHEGPMTERARALLATPA